MTSPETPHHTSQPHLRYEHARQAYDAYCLALGEQPAVHAEYEVSHADPFAHAKAMAADRERYGYVRGETQEYARIQNGTRTLESIGRPFVVERLQVAFDGTDFLDQRGEYELPARRRAVLAAQAMRHADPAFEFYAKRTVYEFYHKLKERNMMLHAPVGSVLGVVSPCETLAAHQAKELGMFPGRNMAVVQLSRKASEQQLEITVFSLDQAELPLLATLLRDHGADVGDDTPAEDFLGHPFTGYAGTHQELMAAYAEPMIRGFDQRLHERTGQETLQGQPVMTAENAAARFWRECGAASDEQLAFDEALSWAASEKPAALHPSLRAFAVQTVDKVRADGLPLLNEQERRWVRELLAAPQVNLRVLAYRDALGLLKKVHETAIDGMVARYMRGEAQALQPLLQARATGGDTGQALTDAASTAAEAGQYSRGCGSNSVFGQPVAANAQSAAPNNPFTVCDVDVDRTPCCGRRGVISVAHNRSTCRECGTYRDATTGRIYQKDGARFTGKASLKAAERIARRQEAARLQAGNVLQRHARHRGVASRRFVLRRTIKFGDEARELIDAKTGEAQAD